MTGTEVGCRGPALGVTDASWSCRWCSSTGGRVMLDLGRQPAADHFPLPGDPMPDSDYPLRMVWCTQCALAQLESDMTTAKEPLGMEPEALRLQADVAVDLCLQAGFLAADHTVLEFASPHGGSWLPRLEAAGLLAAGGTGSVDVVLDCFGMMHEPNQAEALSNRAAMLAPNGTLLLQFHSLAAILRNASWSALRHGHFAYYSSPALIGMAATLGLVAVSAWEFPLYGGTVLIAFRRQGTQDPTVTALVLRETEAGVTSSTNLELLHVNMMKSVDRLQTYLADSMAAGLTVAGYGAASRTVNLLGMAGCQPDMLVGIADASPAKQGRCLPGSRIPVVSPKALADRRAHRVLLFVADLLDEVRATLPEVEAAGGRWVVLEPGIKEVPPISGPPEEGVVALDRLPATDISAAKS